MTIQENYKQVLDKIHNAAKTAGRDPDLIRLVVVTKTHPIETILEVIDAGASDLGENYVEDAIVKIENLSKRANIAWHMIGHVQSRKAFAVCQYFDYLHSLDSVKIAERTNRFCGENNKKMPVFLEVNVSGEETKFGWNLWDENHWIDFIPEFQQVLSFPNIQVRGLMTVPPYSENPEASRPVYQKLRKLQEYLIVHLELPSLPELSIGMSNDYEVAIQEGSTCVRIGQAILGPRK